MMEELILKGLTDLLISAVLFWMLNRTQGENREIRNEIREDTAYMRQLLAEERRTNADQALWMREMLGSFLGGSAAITGRS